jgi:outer membrane protein OmpA-like peptidoglycan-associated protein
LPGIKTILNKIEVKPPATENRIYFDVGSSALKASERAKVVLLKQWLDRHPFIKLRIIGHNDQTGPDAVNRRLAQNRASTIREVLAKGGVSPNRLAAEGGPNLVPGTKPDEGSWAQRCVSFEIIKEPGGARK